MGGGWRSRNSSKARLEDGVSSLGGMGGSWVVVGVLRRGNKAFIEQGVPHTRVVGEVCGGGGGITHLCQRQKDFHRRKVQGVRQVTTGSHDHRNSPGVRKSRHGCRSARAVAFKSILIDSLDAVSGEPCKKA